ncbi:MAG: addiction module toxin RelE, partial [Gammaproteobacteria bacterium]|nr:addiction module toxin RelE [Gammaproteobacteria bacterium]
GSSSFIGDTQCKLDPEQSLKDIPKLQKQSAIKPLEYYKKRYTKRNEAMAKAYLSGHYTLEAVGVVFGVSYATVSRAVKSNECQM